MRLVQVCLRLIRLEMMIPHGNSRLLTVLILFIKGAQIHDIYRTSWLALPTVITHSPFLITVLGAVGYGFAVHLLCIKF